MPMISRSRRQFPKEIKSKKITRKHESMIKIGKLPPNYRFNSIKLRESSLENPVNHMFMSIFSSTRDTAPEHQYICDKYIYMNIMCTRYVYVYIYIMKINPSFVDKVKLSMNIVGVIPPAKNLTLSTSSPSRNVVAQSTNPSQWLANHFPTSLHLSWHSQNPATYLASVDSSRAEGRYGCQTIQGWKIWGDRFATKPTLLETNPMFLKKNGMLCCM